MNSAIISHPWRLAEPILTKRLALRAPSFSDVPAIARMAGDPDVARMLSVVPLPFTEAHASAFVGDVLASNAAGGGLGVVIARNRQPDQAIGMISFAGEGDSAEIGWWLGKAHWGKGYATEAVAAMIKVAFANPRLQCLMAGAFEDNVASLRLHEKFGFKPTGRSTKMNLARGGHAGHVDMMLSRSDFPTPG